LRRIAENVRELPVMLDAAAEPFRRNACALAARWSNNVETRHNLMALTVADDAGLCFRELLDRAYRGEGRASKAIELDGRVSWTQYSHDYCRSLRLNAFWLPAN
jgi:hypothetical protein